MIHWWQNIKRELVGARRKIPPGPVPSLVEQDPAAPARPRAGVGSSSTIKEGPLPIDVLQCPDSWWAVCRSESRSRQ